MRRAPQKNQFEINNLTRISHHSHILRKLKNFKPYGPSKVVCLCFHLQKTSDFNERRILELWFSCVICWQRLFWLNFSSFIPSQFSEMFVVFNLFSNLLSNSFVMFCAAVCVCWLFRPVCRVTAVCFRIVLGIITKKNILEHLEELKQHTEPLVTSPTPLHTWTFPPLFTLAS